MRSSSHCWSGRSSSNCLAREAAVLLLVSLGACGSPATPPVTGTQPAPAEATREADRVEGVVIAALQADALGNSPDSLYAPSPLLVADGEPRTGSPPRFAGIGVGGQVAIGATQIDVNRMGAWAYVEYRWLSTGANQVREARATVVLAPSGGGWRIVHLHSSEVH